MPPVPDNRAEQLVDELRQVDLTGLRAGNLSKLQAVASAFSPGQVPGGGGQEPGGRTLLEQYRRWSAAEKEANAPPSPDAEKINDLRSALADIGRRVDLYASKQLRASPAELEKTRRRQAKVAAHKLKRARAAVALATPAAVEDRAVLKSKKAMRRVVDLGGTTAGSLVAGFAAYRKHGGRLTETAWKNRVARGA